MVSVPETCPTSRSRQARFSVDPAALFRPFQNRLDLERGRAILSHMNDLPPEQRLLPLPDDPEQQEAALNAAKRLDPDARIFPLRPPAGPHLMANNPKAIFEAKMVVRDTRPRKFK